MTQPLVALVDYDADLFDIAPADREGMRDTIETAGGVFVIGQRRNDADVLQMAANADVVMIQSLRPSLNARTIPALTRCRGIIRLGLGYDSVDVKAATAAGIPVSNVVDWCNEEVAEHALALMLAAVRKLAPHDRQMRSGNWERQAARGTMRLSGKTVGLVGFGRIARAVAQRLRPFGVHILAVDPACCVDDTAALGVELVSLDRLLHDADVISVHARLDASSHHLLGRDELFAAKPGVLLINTSRGPLVDEAALVEALAAGHLGGAALDVMEAEPLAPDSPLRRLENVVLTPHIASYSTEAVSQLYRNAAAVAADFLSGRWPATVINPDVRTIAAARRANLTSN